MNEMLEMDSGGGGGGEKCADKGARKSRVLYMRPGKSIVSTYVPTGNGEAFCCKQDKHSRVLYMTYILE